MIYQGFKGVTVGLRARGVRVEGVVVCSSLQKLKLVADIPAH